MNFDKADIRKQVITFGTKIHSNSDGFLRSSIHVTYVGKLNSGITTKS
jgi:hypothetical protein